MTWLYKKESAIAVLIRTAVVRSKLPGAQRQEKETIKIRAAAEAKRCKEA